MNQASRLAVGSFSFLMTLVGVCGAAEQQFSCKGQVIESTGKQESPVDVGFSLDPNGKMSLKMTGDNTLASRVTSNNKIQLKFAAKDFVGEFFHYTGDLFLIYRSGKLARLTCSLVQTRTDVRFWHLADM